MHKAWRTSFKFTNLSLLSKTKMEGNVHELHSLSSADSEKLTSVPLCPEIHVNEIHLPHNRHHKVSSLMKFTKSTQNYIKYEVYEKVQKPSIT